jgi:hypothetical protein
MDRRLTRRALTASAAGFSVGVLARGIGRTAAQEATPAPEIVPLGTVSTRLRVLRDPVYRAEVNADVVERLLPEVEQLEGFGGYVLGDVIDRADQSVAIVVFDEEEQLGAFGEIATDFVQDHEEKVDAEATQEWRGDLLITAAPQPGVGTPVAIEGTPEESVDYMAVRVHTSLPGTDPRDFVPLAISDFVPIVTSIAGFRGYLWYPTEGGFVAISIFDSIADCSESNEAALDWAAEYLTAFTDGNPLIINADVVYRDLPILER